MHNGWFSGFFDADGTINFYFNNKRPQLIISVTNKYLKDISDFQNIFGGNIYFDKSKQGCFKWTICNKELHFKYFEYNKFYPSKSFKGNRIFLIEQFYSLYDLKAYQEGNTILYKAWAKFTEKWQKRLTTI